MSCTSHELVCKHPVSLVCGAGWLCALLQPPEQRNCAALDEHHVLCCQALCGEGQLAPAGCTDLHDCLDRLRCLQRTHDVSRPAPGDQSATCSLVRRTSAGLRKRSSWDTYTAPGKAEPMSPGNREAHSSPGSTMPGKPADTASLGFSHTSLSLSPSLPLSLSLSLSLSLCTDPQLEGRQALACSLSQLKVEVDGVGVPAGVEKGDNLLRLEVLGLGEGLPAQRVASEAVLASSTPQSSCRVAFHAQGTRPISGCVKWLQRRVWLAALARSNAGSLYMYGQAELLCVL